MFYLSPLILMFVTGILFGTASAFVKYKMGSARASPGLIKSYLICLLITYFKTLILDILPKHGDQGLQQQTNLHGMKNSSFKMFNSAVSFNGLFIYQSLNKSRPASWFIWIERKFCSSSAPHRLHRRLYPPRGGETGFMDCTVDRTLMMAFTLHQTLLRYYW